MRMDGATLLLDFSRSESGNAGEEDEAEEPRGSALAQPAPKRKRGAREAEIADGAEHFLTREDGSVACRFIVERAHVLEGEVECAQFRCAERGVHGPSLSSARPEDEGERDLLQEDGLLQDARRSSRHGLQDGEAEAGAARPVSRVGLARRRAIQSRFLSLRQGGG